MTAKILVVDDDVTTLEIYQSCLTDNNYLVETAISGEKAIEYLKTNNVDLIMLDLMMPGINGFKTCRLIKNIEGHHATPIIIVSGKTDVFDKIIGFEVGAVDYLSKPIQFGELISRVVIHLRLAAQKQKLLKRIDELHNLLGDMQNTKLINKQEQTIAQLQAKLSVYESK